jgi:glutamine amidotransferase
MIAIIEYGAGNTRSVMNALDRLNAPYILTADASKILSAEKVIFPGVGHAKHAMAVLKSKGLDEVIKEVTNPLLGICVGMQLLYDYSEEGETECLGIIEGGIKRFDEKNVIVPQIGWNSISYKTNSIFAGLPEEPWFYAVHSYYAEVGEYTISTSRYGLEYSSTVKKNNFFGTQYHPEKSSMNGHLLLENFIKL